MGSNYDKREEKIMPNRSRKSRPIRYSAFKDIWDFVFFCLFSSPKNGLGTHLILIFWDEQTRNENVYSMHNIETYTERSIMKDKFCKKMRRF